MSNVTTLSKREVKSIAENFSADTGLTYRHTALKTVDQCVEQFRKAEEISKIAQAVIKDRIQGEALLQARKLICGDEWNAPKLTTTGPKWLDFLDQIGLTTFKQDGNKKRLRPKTAVSHLLDFAGYKEVEAKMIEDGEDIVPISTASHYREVKKATDTKQPEEVAQTYSDAVKANDGEIPATAKEVVEAVKKSKRKVDSEDVFLREYPQYQDIPSADVQMVFAPNVVSLLPDVDTDEWKSFYRKVAKCLHPDKGGSQEDMSILVSLNEAFEYIAKQRELRVRKEEKNKAYSDWCDERGIEMHDWIDEEEDSDE